jgi:hypothetical protein
MLVRVAQKRLEIFVSSSPKIYQPNITTMMIYLSYAIVGTMAEVGVRRPTARALVLESTEIISQVRALIQTNL